MEHHYQINTVFLLFDSTKDKEEKPLTKNQVKIKQQNP